MENQASTTNQSSETPSGKDRFQDFSGRVARAFRRAIDILSTPDIWPKLRDEPQTIKEVYLNYVLIVAAVSPLAQYLKSVINGAPVFASLFYHVVMYLTWMVVIYLSAHIMAFLAPKFGGKADITQAFKLLAYTMTPGFLAGVFILVPFIGPLLMLVGLYGLYLLYLATPTFVEVPQDKVIIFLLVFIVCSAIAGAIVSAVLMGIAAAMGARPFTPYRLPEGGFDLRDYQRP